MHPKTGPPPASVAAALNGSPAWIVAPFLCRMEWHFWSKDFGLSFSPDMSPLDNTTEDKVAGMVG